MPRLFILLGAGMALLGISAANAAPATLAPNTSLSVEVWGAQGTLSASPTGSFDGTTATVAGGTAFNGIQTVVPISSPKFIYTKASIVLGNNGQIAANLSAGTVQVTGPLTGNGYVANGSGPLITVPIAAGLGSPTSPNVITGWRWVPFLGSQFVTVSGTGWHLGQVQATGLTNYGTLALPNVTTTGGYTITPGGGATVKLVTLSRVTTSGLAISKTAGPIVLTLSYVPEPGTLLLLGAGIAGLVTVGRKRKSA